MLRIGDPSVPHTHTARTAISARFHNGTRLTHPPAAATVPRDSCVTTYPLSARVLPHLAPGRTRRIARKNHPGAAIRALTCDGDGDVQSPRHRVRGAGRCSCDGDTSVTDRAGNGSTRRRAFSANGYLLRAPRTRFFSRAHVPHERARGGQGRAGGRARAGGLSPPPVRDGEVRSRARRAASGTEWRLRPRGTPRGGNLRSGWPRPRETGRRDATDGTGRPITRARGGESRRSTAFNPLIACDTTRHERKCESTLCSRRCARASAAGQSVRGRTPARDHRSTARRARAPRCRSPGAARPMLLPHRSRADGVPL